MESYRVYKSLPVDDFMDMTAFVMAKAEVDLLPLIQDMNHFRKVESHTEEYLKERFIAEVRKIIDSCKMQLNVRMNVFEDVKYYIFTPEVRVESCCKKNVC